MATLLKDLYSPSMIASLADDLQQHLPSLDKTAFQARVFDQAWPELSLKQRLTHIAKVLKDFLPPDYGQALHILIALAPNYPRFEYAFFSEFVALFGMEEDFEVNMLALAYFTQFATAEFAVRPFIERDPVAMLTQAAEWAKSDNEHHRRLASEGLRPRLPWASQLSLFKENPRLLIPILETLKTDDSLYVRKSVANCLNDISKDHPDLIKDLTRKWQTLPKRRKQELTLNPNTQWILKHANRTLLKHSDDMALKLFGFDMPEHINIRQFKADKQIIIGDKLHFEFNLSSKQALGKLRLEFEITFVKAKGKTANKRFFISESIESARKKSVKKSFAFIPRTTRTLYPGQHSLTILVNGQVIKQHAFKLLNA